MKIVYKNIFINSLIAIIILFLGGLVLFQFLKGKLNTEILEDLYIQQNFIKKRLSAGVNIEVLKFNMGDNVTINRTSTFKYKEPIIEDVTVWDNVKKRVIRLKKIVFDVDQSQKHYRINISRAIDKGEGIGENIGFVLIMAGTSMLILLILINIYVYYTLYSPFYKLVKTISTFSLQKLERIIPPKTNTEEFAILGSKIGEMSDKMIADYNSIKEFIENMTHETQTPLAIINTKIERCLQDKNLTNEQAVLLSDAAKAVKNLFNLNKGLSLLSKLDNKQYNSPKEINLKDLVQERVEYFSDFIEDQELILSENYLEETSIFMDIYLSEILIDNLLKNAIKHNFKKGKINITLKKNLLTIANTGLTPTESTDRFFDRFYSQKPQQSLGLGLSIIKKITDYYFYKIVYKYEEDLHQVSITFNKIG